MAEEEVNYASVVFKNSKHPPPEDKKEEETVYDQVKNREAAEQTADTNTGFLPDKKTNNRSRHYRLLACCLGILCVILLSGIIAVSVYQARCDAQSCKTNESKLVTLPQDSDVTTLLAANRDLRNLSDKLSLDNENLRRDRDNLTVQLGNLTQNYTVLEGTITNLTAEVQNLGTQKQQLETQRNDLIRQIQDMETSWNNLNVSRAQWSIDSYCPRKENGRQCKRCQDGWKLTEPNCYVIHDGKQQAEWITWEAARADCRGKSSDLAVVHTDEEKEVIKYYSWGDTGYWIGLRVEDMKWKWIDGSDLTQTHWITAPTEGHCAVSLPRGGWKSVRCDERKRWICKKEALSV